MGNAFEGCQKCTQTQIFHTANQLHQISTFYKTRLTQNNQISANIPYYNNQIHYRLANCLRIRDQKFQDSLYPCQDLLHDSRIQWKRIQAVYPNQPFSRSINNFQFQYIKKQNNKTYTRFLVQALYKLKDYPELVRKIFANTEISKQGFYVVYFALGGNSQKRVEIIVDDYIPVDANNKYIFQQPKQGDGIWMIILHKVWAKILRSYHHIQNLGTEYYFAEMTGVPLQQLYNKGDFLMSGQYEFEGNQSKYLKIYKDLPVKMLICIWQPINLDFSSLEPTEFVVEVITQKITPQQKTYHLLPLKTQRIGNKIILLNTKNTKQMFQLPSGQNIIHIYNKNRAKRSCNIVINSRIAVNTHTRYQKQFRLAKISMIINQYKKLHSQIGIIQYEYPGIQLRFCWINHRGIFCLKNNSKQNKEIQMNIKKSFMNQISFQDSKQLSKNLMLSMKQYGFFIVVRSQDREYGHFYQISLIKGK